MLARLQQALTLGLVLLASGWAWLCVHNGHVDAAWAGVAMLLGAYVLVLGIEFVLLFFVHRGDPTPRATAALLLEAWWGEVVSAPRVFCWRQPFRSRRWPDSPPRGAVRATPASTRRGVVFVHGFVCNRGLWNPWLQQMTAQGTPFVAVNLEPVFGTIDDHAPTIDSAVRHVQRCTGLPPVIVAHSMGGLAVRAWQAQSGNDRLVHRVITIGTPHQGTWLARFATTLNARQMRQHSPWLQRLVSSESPAFAQQFTCFYSHCDNIVFPAAFATLPGAHNIHLRGVAHVHMADHPEPLAELQRWLQPTTGQ